MKLVAFGSLPTSRKYRRECIVFYYINGLLVLISLYSILLDQIGYRFNNRQFERYLIHASYIEFSREGQLLIALSTSEITKYLLLVSTLVIEY